MGILASPAIWQQFVDHIIQEQKYPDDYKIIMDDALVCTKVANHTECLQDLFRVLQQFRLKYPLINVNSSETILSIWA